MLSRLLPPVDLPYGGSRWSLYFLIFLTVTSTGRSLVHLLIPDGGAHTIAGLAVNVAGGPNIIAIFAQWGASQLIMACFEWIVILRYRFLVPAMLAVVILEDLLRQLAGTLKPLQVPTPPPGAYANHVILPLALMFFILSLRRNRGGAR